GGETLVGRCPSGVSPVGNHVRCPRRAALRFCKRGRVTRCNQRISFRQWTDKGYVFCRAEIPLEVCDCCGAKHWNQDAEAIINEVVQARIRQASLALLGACTHKGQPLADVRFAPKAAK